MLVLYFGICKSLLMHGTHVFSSDDEVPTGLELIGKALEQRKDGDNVFSTCRIIFSSLLRIGVGAMFLTCLFFVVIQESNVLDIFFDVLGEVTLLPAESVTLSSRYHVGGLSHFLHIAQF